MFARASRNALGRGVVPTGLKQVQARHPRFASFAQRAASNTLSEFVGHAQLGCSESDDLARYLDDPLQIIGEGAHGEVFLAKMKGSNKNVALKGLNKDPNSHEWVDEIKLPSCSSDPSLVKPVFVFETPDRFYIASELCRGKDMFDFFLETNVGNGKLSEESALRILKEMMIAVDACHNADFAHLDVKPENFMFKDYAYDIYGELQIEGNIGLIDFGHAKQLGTKFDPSQDTRLIGTAEYAAPETIKGHFGTCSDIWSVGVSFFMLCTGTRPFQLTDDELSASPSEEWRNLIALVEYDASFPIGESEYSTRVELDVFITPETKQLCLDMLEPCPENRPTCTEIIDRIDDLLASN